MTRCPVQTRLEATPVLWSTLDTLARARGPRLAAIAYVTDGSALPLSEGDVLICDASPGAIRSGQTSAKVLHRLVSRGAAVYSYPGLHAKVLVAGATLVVGSANHSSSSRSLMEAGICTSDPALVSDAIAFVRALQKDRVRCDALTPAAVKRLLSIKVERGGWKARMRRVKTRAGRPHRSARAGWVTGCYEMHDHEEPAEVLRAQERLSRSMTSAANVMWYRVGRSSKVGRTARAGQQVILLWRASKPATRVTVYPPVHIIDRIQPRSERAVYLMYAEKNRDGRMPLSLSEFESLLKASGCSRLPKRLSTFELSPAVVANLNQQWPRKSR